MAAKNKTQTLQGGGDALEKLDADKLRSDIGSHLSTYVDLKCAALEEKLGGQMTALDREVSAKLDGKPGTGTLVINSAVIIGIILSVILGTLAFGGQAFNGGMSATGALAQVTAEQDVRQKQLDAKIDALSNQIAAMQQNESKKGAAK